MIEHSELLREGVEFTAWTAVDMCSEGSESTDMHSQHLNYDTGGMELAEVNFMVDGEHCGLERAEHLLGAGPGVEEH